MDGTLKTNVGKLAKLIGLDDVEQQILEFTAILHTNAVLESASQMMGDLKTSQVFVWLGSVLNLPSKTIAAALHSSGKLNQAGLLWLDRRGAHGAIQKLSVLSSSFADLLVSIDVLPVDLLRGMISKAASSSLALDDYPHLQDTIRVARPYLSHALNTQRLGVNFFFYGVPGTGKTELTRALATDSGCDLMEVATEDEEGHPISGERRLRALRAAHCIFNQQRVLIMFDEVEDVFKDGRSNYNEMSSAQTRKGWLNRTLESNQTPTIWISNTRTDIDPAFIRRFDIVCEIPIPPKSQREKILRKECAGLVSDATISRMAGSESLAPAVVSRAAAVVKSVHRMVKAGQESKSFQLLINNTLEAQGHRRIGSYDSSRLPEIYDPGFIHADADLSAIAQGLASTRSGRLCFYGPPGTGKTAYGRWLAEQLDMPLLIKRASDLKSMWVGESEKNIACAFKQAEDSDAILMIDEIDSFLQDRRHAQRSWEITEVNEMLTQMESYSGVLIASTNLMNGLDQASLRRFDLKAKFDYLRSEQATRLLQNHCTHLAIPQPDSIALMRVSLMQRLTPGDFATVIRQSRFRPLLNVGALVDALENECSLKEGQKSSIGFV
ncbi:MAG: ATP-binding protein [Brachymonas sp.]|nr:ATP-binding protein [Brachymonas sp.]